MDDEDIEGMEGEDSEDDNDSAREQRKECSARLSISEPDARGARAIVLEADNPKQIEECISADIRYVLQGGALIEKQP